MDTILWLLIFSGLLIVLVRWMLAWGTRVVSRQTVRQFFLQRVAAAYPGLQVLRGEDRLLSLLIEGQECIIHFDQLYRRCAEAPTQTNAFIRQAVKGVIDALQHRDGIPDDWESTVVPLLLRLDIPTPPGIIIQPLVESLGIGYALQTATSFRWLTSQEVTEAGIDFEHLSAIAIRNLERSCNALVIESPHQEPDGHERFIRFLTADGLDAARLLLPSFYQRFSPRFEDSDLLVAIPSRDSLAIISMHDHALASLLAWRNAQERHRRAYPLYPRLLRVSEQGVTPWTPGQPVQA